ncbi:MAG: PEP/pyruvate-binding domain-containing protein, partial [Candidatus Methanoperedens sp.]
MARSVKTHIIDLGFRVKPEYLAEFRFGRAGLSMDGGEQRAVQAIVPSNFLVLPLKDAKDASRFGGKTASLSKMMELGYRVPDGIAISKEAYEEFILRLDLSTTINDILKEANIDMGKPETAMQAAQRIQEYMLAREMPVDMRDILAAGYRGLTGKGKAALKVSVRSSAIGEDSDLTAFAGQFTTILN